MERGALLLGVPGIALALQNRPRAMTEKDRRWAPRAVQMFEKPPEISANTQTFRLLQCPETWHFLAGKTPLAIRRLVFYGSFTGFPWSSTTGGPYTWPWQASGLNICTTFDTASTSS